MDELKYWLLDINYYPHRNTYAVWVSFNEKGFNVFKDHVRTYEDGETLVVLEAHKKIIMWLVFEGQRDYPIYLIHVVSDSSNPFNTIDAAIKEYYNANREAVEEKLKKSIME